MLAVSAAPTKEELIKTAEGIDAAIGAEIEKIRKTHPGSIATLDSERREIKTLISELNSAKLPTVIANLERRLTLVGTRAEATIAKLEGKTATPAPTTVAP